MAVERAAGCLWNQWPDHRGMGGRMGAEYAAVTSERMSCSDILFSVIPAKAGIQDHLIKAARDKDPAIVD